MPGGRSEHWSLFGGNLCPSRINSQYKSIVNRSPVQELFASSIGREVTAPDIRDRFDQALGPGAGEREREACRDDCSRCLISAITIGLRGDVTGGMLVPGLILASSPTDVGCPAGILDPVGPQ